MFFLQAPLQSPTGLGTRRWDPETDKGLMEGGDGHDVVDLFAGLTRLKVKKLTRRR